MERRRCNGLIKPRRIEPDNHRLESKTLRSASSARKRPPNLRNPAGSLFVPWIRLPCVSFPMSDRLRSLTYLSLGLRSLGCDSAKIGGPPPFEPFHIMHPFLSQVSARLRLPVLFGIFLTRALGDGGSIDPTFQPPPIPFGVTRVALQSDGKVLVAGGMRPDASAEPKGLIRLNTDGSRDSTFDVGTGFSAAVFPQFNTLTPTDAGILVGGLFDQVNGKPHANLVRLLSTGLPDPGFSADTDGSVLSVVPIAGGKLLVAGGFKKINGIARDGLARLNADGTVDPAFSPAWGSLIVSAVRSLAVTSDGKIVVGGTFLSFSAGLSAKAVARLNADGTFDSTFTPPGLQFLTDGVTDLVLQADGKLVVIGGFQQLAGTTHRAIARLNANGTLDTTWPGSGIGTFGYEGIADIASTSDGRLIIGGAFATYNGDGPAGIARLSANGVRDLTFKKPSASSTFSISSLAIQSDGNVIIGGVFTLGSTVDSTKLLLRLLDKDAGPPPAPTISRQPAPLAVNLGATGKTLSVEASGTPPLSYQWQFNSANLPFKTDAVLSFGAIKESDAGNYRVIVTNPGGSVTSSVVALSVILPARITQGPSSRSAAVGDTVVFSVGVSGTPPFTYQWRKDFENLPGQTGSTLTLSPVSLSDAGAYTVVVENNAGGESSADAILTVAAVQPRITAQPVSQSVTLPESQLSASVLSGRQLCLSINGALAPWILRGSYCISFDGANYSSPAGGALSGGSAGTFSVHPGTAPPATLIDFARFFPDGQTATLSLLSNGIFEFNRDGLVADQNGTWQLNPPFVPPAGPSVTFAVSATGSGTLKYQWRKNGKDLPGAAGPSLTLTNLAATDAGDYTVLVSDAGGSTLSDPAHLLINAAATALVLSPKILPTGLLSLPVTTQVGKTYALERRTSLGEPAWTTAESFVGDGSVHSFQVPFNLPAAFYRVTQSP